MKRKRTIDGASFFKTVLFDHLSYQQCSLEFHASSLVKETGSIISKQALDKRFNNKAAAFFERILADYLSKQNDHLALPSELTNRFSSIRIMDSTEFQVHSSLSESFPGYGGDGTKACAQVQFEYEAFSGSIKQLSLDASVVSDVSYGRKSLPNEGELLLRDLGYYNFNAYQEVIDSKGFYISKLKSQVKIFELKEGKYVPLSHQQMIERLESQDEQYFDQEVYLGAEKKLAVRMTASLVSEESIAKRIKKLRKRHTKVTEASRLAARLNILITNIDNDVSAEQLYQLYRLRWQIELIFKAWKSVLKLPNFGQMKAERLKCYLYAKLLWIMVSWDIYQHGTRYCWKEYQRSLSINKVYQQVKLYADTLRELMGKKYRSIKRWLENVLYLCLKYGKKDQKNGRVKTEEILMQVVGNQI